MDAMPYVLIFVIKPVNLYLYQQIPISMSSLQHGNCTSYENVCLTEPLDSTDHFSRNGKLTFEKNRSIYLKECINNPVQL